MATELDIKVLVIETVYYNQKGEPLKRNASKTAHNAVLRCIHHMTLNSYMAHSAEVYDTETGKLYCVIRTRIRGIEIVFQEDLKNQSIHHKGRK